MLHSHSFDTFYNDNDKEIKEQRKGMSDTFFMSFCEGGYEGGMQIGTGIKASKNNTHILILSEAS